jgi:prolyl 4-hydroxylase
VLDYLAYATFMQDNVYEALRLSEELLKLDPTNERVLNNTIFYGKIIEQKAAEGIVVPTEVKNVRAVDEYRSTEEFITYEKLCRGEKTRNYTGSRGLTCQLRRHHPIFYIRPLKEEVVHVQPRIVVFHDVLSDLDIAKIKELAIPRLNRATVQNAVTGQLETATYRVSKSAWLKDEENVRINRVSQIARAMTNLTLDTVEELQVVNYGIGGHYEPHFDFARPKEVSAFEEWRGNRVATFICYMSEVVAGGATVFPAIGARLIPEKGACAVWYNLMLSGEGDYATRHAACPVLVGSKWVCNKWFHERGQEFSRPCALSYEQ